MVRSSYLFLTLCCSASLWLGPVQAEESWPVPKLFAEAAVAIDAETGIFLYEKNADDQRAVASTQKLLTALIVAEAGDLDKLVKVESTDTRVEPS